MFHSLSNLVLKMYYRYHQPNSIVIASFLMWFALLIFWNSHLNHFPQYFINYNIEHVERSALPKWKSNKYCRDHFSEIESSDRHKFTFEFEKELSMILDYIRCGVPFAFVRMGDGEFELVQGNDITSQDVSLILLFPLLLFSSLSFFLLFSSSSFLPSTFLPFQSFP